MPASNAGKPSVTLLLVRDDQMSMRPGEFGQRHGGELRVPEAVAQLAMIYGLSEAADLCAWADTFPSAMAGGLGWKEPDVRAAVVALSGLLASIPQGSAADRGGGVALPHGVVPNVTTAADLARERKER